MSKYLEFDTPATEAGQGPQGRLRAQAPRSPPPRHACSGTCPPPPCTRRPSSARRGTSSTAGRSSVNTGKWTRARRPGQVPRARAEHRGQGLVGDLQPPLQRREVQRPFRPGAGLPAGRGALRPGLPRRRRPRLPDADPDHHRDTPGRACSRATCSSPSTPRTTSSGTCRSSPSWPPRASAPTRASTAPDRHRHHHQLRSAPGADLQHLLRRRDQEDHLHGPQLPAAVPRSHADALLGQRRLRRRRGPLLRPLGHRQDDPVRRPQAPPDRRRRARLELDRSVQLRGGLLRQGDPAVSRARAADLLLHPPLRHHPGERRLRPHLAATGPRRRPLHREHPRLLPARLHPQRGR